MSELSEYIDSINCKYHVRYVGFNKSGPMSNMDKWDCQFNGVHFDYYTGIGHRNKFDRPVAPKPDGVLYALMSDSEALNTSFHFWCSDFGYDNDSIKHFNIYQDCCNNALKFRGIFSQQQLDTIRILSEDY